MSRPYTHQSSTVAIELALLRAACDHVKNAIMAGIESCDGAQVQVNNLRRDLLLEVVNAAGGNRVINPEGPRPIWIPALCILIEGGDQDEAFPANLLLDEIRALPDLGGDEDLVQLVTMKRAHVDALGAYCVGIMAAIDTGTKLRLRERILLAIRRLFGRSAP